MLYIFWRNSEEIDINEYVNRIEEACNKLAPGFSCLILFPKYRKLSQWEEDLLLNSEKLMYAYGLNSVVRVGNKRDGLDSFKNKFMQKQYTVDNA